MRKLLPLSEYKRVSGLLRFFCLMWASVERILSIYTEIKVSPITHNTNQYSKVAERVI